MEYLVNALIILLNIAYLLALYLLAVKAEERMMRYFDTKWLPAPARRLRVLPPGVRLLIVREQFKPAIVIWAMLKTEAIIIGLSLVVGILLGALYLGSWYVAYWRMDGNVASASVRELVLLFTSPFFLLQIAAVVKYWLVEWERRRTRLVVRSNRYTLTDMKPTFIGLIFGRAPKPVIIEERTSLLKRAMTAADIQTLKPDYKTPGLRDQLTYLMAGRSGLGSVLLPSEVYGDLDAFRWVEEVDELVVCLYKAAELAADEESSDNRAGFFADQKMYKVYDDTDSPDEAEAARIGVLDANVMFKERRAQESVIDIFDEKDPGLCKGGALKIEEEEMPAVISIAPRMGLQPPPTQDQVPVVESTERGKTPDEDDDRLPRSKLV